VCTWKSLRLNTSRYGNRHNGENLPPKRSPARKAGGKRWHCLGTGDQLGTADTLIAPARCYTCQPCMQSTLCCNLQNSIQNHTEAARMDSCSCGRKDKADIGLIR